MVSKRYGWDTYVANIVRISVGQNTIDISRNTEAIFLEYNVGTAKVSVKYRHPHHTVRRLF
jgi:hypothetical protein